MQVEPTQSFMALLAERLFARPPRALHLEELTAAIAAEHARDEAERAPSPPLVDVQA